MIPFDPMTDGGEKARKDAFFASLDTPSDISTILNRASELRMRMEQSIYPKNRDQYTVVTHHILRTQQALLAHLTATDPAANFKVPVRWDNELGAPVDEYKWLASGLDRLVNYFIKKGKLLGSLNTLARDAYTVRAGWLKVIWEGDKYRTPNGAKIMDPKVRQQIKWRALKERYEAGEFEDDSSEYSAMKDAEDTVRLQVVDNMRQYLTAQYGEDFVMMTINEDNPANDPEVARFYELMNGAAAPTLDEVDEIPHQYKFSFDVIDIEDMRIDFQVGRPEHYKRSPLFSHRVRMTKDQIVGTYDVPASAFGALTNGESTDSNDFSAQDVGAAKHDDGSETAADSQHHDVWETWDEETGYVYTYTRDVDGWLRKVPWGVYDEAPFFLYTMNDVAGTLYGPSHVELLWDLQNEMNDLRRNQRQNRRAAMPKLLAQEGSIEDSDATNYENSDPFSIIFVSNVEDIKKATMQLNGAPYIPQMYDRQDTLMDFQLSSGMPSAGLGATATSNLATEVAFAREELDTQLQRMKFTFNQMLTDVVSLMSRIIVRALPMQNVLAIAGQTVADNWPEDPDLRENLMLDLVLDVKANATGKPDRGREIDHLTKVSNIMAQQGAQMSMPWMLSKLAEIEDSGLDWHNAMLQQGPMPQQAQAPGPTEGVPDGPPPAAGPNPTGAAPGPAPGSAGGGFTSTPQVDSVPGG